MHQRSSYSRFNPIIPGRSTYEERKLRSSKYLDPNRKSPNRNEVEDQGSLTISSITPQNQNCREPKEADLSRRHKSLVYQVDSMPKTENAMNRSPMSKKTESQSLVESDNKLQDKILVKSDKLCLNLMASVPQPDKAFKSQDPKYDSDICSRLDSSFTLRIAKPDRKKSASPNKSITTTADFSKSLIDKKSFILDNETDILLDQDDALKKKLGDLKRMHHGLRRDNLDLKIEIMEKQIVRRDMDEQLRLLDRKLGPLDEQEETTKKLKTHERLLKVENSIRTVKTADSHSLMSKLISMTRKHATEVRTAQEDVERVKDQSEMDKSKLRSVRVVQLSQL